MSIPIVSLCIPTNGVTEWVFPVLDCIYSQGCNNEEFEVVITDNGNNLEFKKQIQDYLSSHVNLVYAETTALPFLNEIEAYKRARGQLIKFVNHRAKLTAGTLQRIIDFTKENIATRPIIYFANGKITKYDKEINEYDSFDGFVKGLSFYSSWSSGMTIWKEDFDKLPSDVSAFNELFPHTNILFQVRNRDKYIIDHTVIFEEIEQGRKPKGNYDLFGAFGIEYPGIICDLLRDGDITADTYRYVAGKNLGFIAALYVKHCMKKEYCSYDLSGLNNIFGVYYSKMDFVGGVVKYIFRRCVKKLRRR